jgi:hypothetical protein
MGVKQLGQPHDVATADRLERGPDLLCSFALGLVLSPHPLDRAHELTPGAEAVLTGDHELSVSEVEGPPEK